MKTKLQTATTQPDAPAQAGVLANLASLENLENLENSVP
jgi:hypothetical protein